MNCKDLINMYKIQFRVLVLAIVSFVFLASCTKKIEAEKPNIIYIMLDEVGYYEPSYMGNTKLQTPNIDKMAHEGMVFTNAYSGAAVCGPTRVSLMTGKHLGHTSMRENSGGEPIRADEKTVASLLQEAGYINGGFGKWGCGNRGTSGVPEEHGFDIFFGYYDQVHAHSFYPEYLIKNSQEVPLKGNTGDYYQGETHAQDVIFNEAVKFIKANADKPFFCYLPWTPPHGLWGISEEHPSYQLFSENDWPSPNSWKTDDAIRYAALLHKTDGQIGEILDLLKSLEIDDRTLIFFSGDNGGQDYFNSDKNPRGIFGPNVNPDNQKEFRGQKGTVYEGGLKIPMLVRWPNVILPGSRSDLLWYFPDFLATVADIIKVRPPEDCDGMSILPELSGSGKQVQHDYLVWGQKNKYAVRQGDWKLHATLKDDFWSEFELYDLKADPGESSNLVQEQAMVADQLKVILKDAYTPPIKGEIYDHKLYLKDHQVNPPKPKKQL